MDFISFMNWFFPLIAISLVLFMGFTIIKGFDSDDSENEIIAESNDKEKLSIKEKSIKKEKPVEKEKPIEKIKIPKKPEVKKETPKPKFCTNCGNPYFNKTAFCTNCGNKII